MFYYFLSLIGVGMNQLYPNSMFRTKFFSSIIIIITSFIVFLVAILNPIEGDMDRYLRKFEANGSLSLMQALSQSDLEIGFVVYQWVLFQVFSSPTIFIITSVSVIWFITLWASAKVIKYEDLPLIALGYISFFYFYNFITNIIRQGFAVALIMLIVVYLIKKEKTKAILAFIVALSFHISSIIVVIIFLIKKLKISLNILYIIFIFSVVLMLTGINEILMSNLFSLFGGGIIEESINSYSSEETIEQYGGGTNRYNFLIFTSFWALLGFFFNRYYLTEDAIYQWFLKCYLGLSIIYLLLGYIAFSDRLASYAWFMIPIILFYPITKKNIIARRKWFGICVLISIIIFFFFNVFSYLAPLKVFY